MFSASHGCHLFVCSLLQKLVHDLRMTISPMHNFIQGQLLKLLPRTLSAETLKTILDTFSVVFKYVTIPSEFIQDAWAAFAEVLPRCDPEVQRAVAELWGVSVRRIKLQARATCVLSIISTASTDISSWVFVSACTVRSVLLPHYISLKFPFSVRVSDITHYNSYHIFSTTPPLSFLRQLRWPFHSPATAIDCLDPSL